MVPRSPLPARAGDRGPRRIGLGLAALGRPGYLNLGLLIKKLTGENYAAATGKSIPGAPEFLKR